MQMFMLRRGHTRSYRTERGTISSRAWFVTCLVLTACCQDGTEVLVTLTRAGRPYTHTPKVRSLVETWTLSHKPPEWQTVWPKGFGQEFSPLKESVYLVLPPVKPQLRRSPCLPCALEPSGCRLCNTDLPWSPGRTPSASSSHVGTICHMTVLIQKAPS